MMNATPMELHDPALKLEVRAINDVTLFENSGRMIPDKALDDSFFSHDRDGKVFFRDAKELKTWGRELMTRCTEMARTGNEHNINVLGLHYRVQAGESIHGKFYKLRRLSDIKPTLEKLTVPTYWPEILTLDRLALDGGLVIFAGPKSNAKTTLMMATLVTSVTRNAGYGITIEAPYEYVLGTHHPHPDGPGTIVQMDATKSGFVEAVRQSARGYDKNTYQYLAIGEIRDHETAAAAVTSANAGDLVFLTIHANRPYDALNRIVLALQGGPNAYNAEAAREALARALRVVVIQRLGHSDSVPNEENPFPHPITGSLVYSRHSRSKLATAVIKGDSHAFDKAVEEQQQVFQSAIDPETGRGRISVRELVAQLSPEE